MDAGAVRDAYLALDLELKRWAARTHEGSTLLDASCDFHSRLQLVPRDAGGAPAAARSAAFGVLARDERFVAVLRAKHELGLHNLLAALRQTAGDLAKIDERLGALTSDAWRRFGSGDGLALGDSTQPLWATMPGALGTALRERIRVPSVAQALEDHVALGSCVRAELRLKLQLLARASASASEAELRELSRLWALEPHIDAERVHFVRSLAQCFED
jgi:hypothetical protein